MTFSPALEYWLTQVHGADDLDGALMAISMDGRKGGVPDEVKYEARQVLLERLREKKNEKALP